MLRMAVCPLPSFLLHQHSLTLLTAPYYQPETTQKIFNRIMFNTDVSTGSVSSLDYTSKGLASAWSVSKLPTYNKTASCYLWDVLETCTEEQGAVLYSGKAIVKDFVLIGIEGQNSTIA